MSTLRPKTENRSLDTLNNEPKEKRIRYTVIDILRGIALLNMIAYHTVWDLVRIFGVNIAWFRSDTAHIWQQSICWTFILLSGFCWSMGRRKLKRGILLIVCSAVISAVTLIFMPNNRIMYGILTLIGSGMLILIPLDKPFRKLNPYICALLSLTLFILTRNTGIHMLGFEDWNLLPIPDILYANILTAYLGFPPAGFVSRDYFPLIPWLFLYITGYFICRIFERLNIMQCLASLRIKPIEWIGRHTLIIYMLHQPVVYAILYFIFEIIRK